MPLSRLPLSLQHCLLLEWLSPEAVWAVASISTALRESVVSSPLPFRAAQKEVLSDACVHWFQENNVQLHLWLETVQLYYCVIHLANGRAHSTDDRCAVERINGQQSRREWYRNGRRHRDGDEPAVYRKYKGNDDGLKEWYQNGRRHRENDMPAVMDNRLLVWYQHGRIHRDGDKFAVRIKDRCTEWRQHGLLHRDGDEPARILPGRRSPNGSTFWYCRGLLHRNDDKPAAVWEDGITEWWTHGEWVRSEPPAKGPRFWFFDTVSIGTDVPRHWGISEWFDTTIEDADDANDDEQGQDFVDC